MRIDQQAAEAGDGEDRLDHGDAAEQIAEHQADQRPGRAEGILEAHAARAPRYSDRPLARAWVMYSSRSTSSVRGARHADEHADLDA